VLVLYGSVSTRAQSSAGTNQTLTFAPSSGVSFTSILEVYCDQGDATPTASWNGNSVNPGGGAWVTVFTGSGTINATYPLVINTQGASQYATLKGVRLDGKLLVDNGVSVANVPSIAATGASVGTKQGFSIVSYTSESGTGDLTATIPHGLNENIGFMIIKSRDFSPSSKGWAVWHQSSPTTNGYLDDNQQFLNSEYTSFIDATPTNSVFSVKCNSSVSSGNRYRTYGNSHNYIAYLWHDVPGLQKFGKWQGNANADGPYIETGFRPAIILYKDLTAGGFWNIKDTSRTTYNGATNELYPATNEIENHHNSNRPIDFLSNGFKIRSSHSAINDGSRQYMYAAWAEAPTFNLYGAQSNAR